MKLSKCFYCKKISFCTTSVTEIKDSGIVSYAICKNCTEDLYPKETIKTQEKLIGFLQEISPKPKNLTCSCGFTAKDFEKTGRFGCPKCYDTFEFYIKKFVEPYHKASEHKGKKPKNNIEKIKLLKSKLDYAIKTEQYEKAAELKKQIDSLQGFM